MSAARLVSVKRLMCYADGLVVSTKIYYAALEDGLKEPGKCLEHAIQNEGEESHVCTVLDRYLVHQSETAVPDPAQRLMVAVKNPLKYWAGGYLNVLEFSGSYAKGTRGRGVSDVDIFISLKADTRVTLKELYEGLVQFALSRGWNPCRQNISVGVSVNGRQGDLVPGRVQKGQPDAYSSDHSLYVNKKQEAWTQTNVYKHIEAVKEVGKHDSRCINTIRAIKI